MMFSKSATATIIATATIFGATACKNNDVPTQNAVNHSDAVESINKLNEASKIDFHQSAIALNKTWDIKVNGNKIANLRGLYFKTYGEVYSMVSPKGGFMGGEDEDIFHMSPTATFYDMDHNSTSILHKSIFSWFAEYKLKDRAGNNIATLNERFGLTFNGDIKNSQGNTAWKFNKSILSWGSDYTLTKVGNGVSAMDAVRMVAVAHEIDNAKSKKH